jgi:hypothetical protein
VTATSMDPFSAFHVHSYYTHISTCKERLDMDVLREGLRSRGDNDDPIGLATRTTLPLCLAGDSVTLPIYRSFIGSVFPKHAACGSLGIRSRYCYRPHTEVQDDLAK